MIAQKQIDYAVEVDALMAIFVSFARDIKLGKTPAQIVADLLPQVLGAVVGIGQVANELSQSPKVVEETIGYRLGDVMSALTLG